MFTRQLRNDRNLALFKFPVFAEPLHVLAILTGLFSMLQLANECRMFENIFF